VSPTLNLRHVILLTTGLVVTVLVAVDAGPLVRGPLAFSLLLIGPGLAWTWIFDIESHEMEAVLAVALSVGSEILVGLLLLGMGQWSPDRLLIVVLVAVIAGVATEILTAGRSAREAM